MTNHKKLVQPSLFGDSEPAIPVGGGDKPPMREAKVPVKAHLRKVQTRKEESGEERFRVAVASMEGKEAQKRVLDHLRARLITLSVGGPVIVAVSADDARYWWNQWAERPTDVKIDKLFGAIFKTRGWRAVGLKVSEWPGNNGRYIRTWVYEGEDSASEDK